MIYEIWMWSILVIRVGENLLIATNYMQNTILDVSFAWAGGKILYVCMCKCACVNIFMNIPMSIYSIITQNIKSITKQHRRYICHYFGSHVTQVCIASVIKLAAGFSSALKLFQQ